MWLSNTVCPSQGYSLHFSATVESWEFPLSWRNQFLPWCIQSNWFKRNTIVLAVRITKVQYCPSNTFSVYSLSLWSKLCSTSSWAKSSASLLQRVGKKNRARFAGLQLYCHICSDCRGMVCKQLPGPKARTNIASSVCSLCALRQRDCFNIYSTGYILAPLCFPGTAAIYVRYCIKRQAWGFYFFMFYFGDFFSKMCKSYWINLLLT